MCILINSMTGAANAPNDGSDATCRVATTHTPKKVCMILLFCACMFLLAAVIPACKDGKDGNDGVAGKPASIVTISSDCTWVIDGVDTGKPACPESGDDKKLDIKIGDNGNWWVNGKDTEIPAYGTTGPDGPEGETGPMGPGIGSMITIGANGNWYINGYDTGVSSLGSQIEIGANGNWWIDGKDTEVSAVGVTKSLAEKLVIGIWVPPQPQFLTSESDIKMRFKQVADAGINTVWGEQWEYGSGNEMTPMVLDACEEYGLGFLLYLNVETSGTGNVSTELTRCIETVNKYKNHPAVCGFAMNDEPNASAFDRMAIIRSNVDANLPKGKYAVTNLFPNYASDEMLGSPNYETHVDDYMRKVQPKVLSFDHYPLYKTSDAEERLSHDRSFVSNLITIRNASVKYNVPFWGFVQAIGWSIMREPTVDEYRWLCNAHIAFGAKGISYFIYAQFAPPEGDGSNGMLDWSGNTTHLYDYAKQNNKELSAFADMVMPFMQDGFILVNQNAQMTTTIPSNLRKTSYGNISKIEATGEMLNGCFDLNGKKAVYLFNWEKDKSNNTKLVFDKNTTFELWGKDGLEEEQTATELNLSFSAGEAKLLIIKN